jgi:hypothetical protein
MPVMSTPQTAYGAAASAFLTQRFLAFFAFFFVFLAFARYAPTFLEECPAAFTAALSLAGVTLNFFDQ